MHTDTLRFNHNFALPRRFLAGAMIFTAAYFVSISVNAQPAAQNAPDVIQMNDNGPTTVTGTITEVDGKVVTIDSGGTPMRINLEEVELQGGAEDVFKLGMDVTAVGEMTGNNFGTPIIKAQTITAREAPKPQ